MGKKKKRRKALKEKMPSKEEPTVQEKPESRKKKKKRQQLPKDREHPNWPLTALAVAGMALTAYLVLISLLGEYPLYCDEGSTCDIVQQSRWGKFLGVPTALLGFLTYTALAYIGFRVRNLAQHWKLAWIISLVGLGYSLYLNTISFFVIEAMCAYCLASLSIMAVIFVTVVFQLPEGMPNFKYPVWAGKTIVLTLIIIGGMHLNYSGVFDPAAGAEDPYLKELAEHLTEDEAVLYGAFW